MQKFKIWQIFRLSFVTLPYLFYVSFVGIFVVMLLHRLRFGRVALDPLTRNSLAIIGGLLILSCGFAENRSEALLQLANFLPFFLFFSVLPYVLTGTERLGQLALDLVIAAIPLNLLALCEYILKSTFIPRVIRRIPSVRSLRNAPHKGRAMVVFTHPNSLANYLVLILGLGLGLILYDASRSSERLEPQQYGRTRKVLLYVGTFLTLVGIFCSGSRNGLLVAIVQIILFCLCVQGNRKILLPGLFSVLALLAGSAVLGIGRRSLDILHWADDPRPRVWSIAWDLIKERPVMGWGLGNYKLEFVPRLLAQYPSCLMERTYKVIPSNCADVNHPHNFWLLLSSEVGLGIMLGFSLWVGFICWQGVLRVMTAQLSGWSRSVLYAYLFAFFGCISFAIMDVTFYDVRLNATNWLLLAGIYSATREGEKS
ncbi:MAG: O-antigen ligase family protein [Timaviella obliquedivisa GSE-PSE-MK23-08B]|jgi:O-antigen ligase|nr:O-antigen ligase family protein [Timaviella obliquedivisa GSE-PSE-MK23-08B]